MLTVSVSFFLLSLVGTHALDNGLALTPPMGWMTWERFACESNCEKYPKTCISEDLIMRQADAFKEKGFLDAGYQYMVIDDCWMGKRDPETQELTAHPQRFSHGMKYTSDYVTSKGISFGIYLDFGTLTCGGYPGSELHLHTDALTMKAWNVSYVKMDGCYANHKDFEAGYEAFTDFINGTNHPVVFSCSYPAYMNWETANPYDWGRLQKNCNLWRMYYDITDNWDSIVGIIKLYKTQNEKLSKYGGVGHWNDPDMLMAGNFGLSTSQAFAQMGMWGIFAAPLIMSTDLTTIDPEMMAILQDKDLIALDQDVLGKPGQFLFEHDKISYWKRELSNNRVAIAILNENTVGTPAFVDVNFSDFGIPTTEMHKTFDLKTKQTEKYQQGYKAKVASSSLDLRIVKL